MNKYKGGFKDIKNILYELEKITREELKTQECVKLNEYFFGCEEFMKSFCCCVGGSGSHHNYEGGLAEHTLNVMYLSKIIAYRYNCINKEIAILGAKLHDIGKIREYDCETGKRTITGEMTGHIVCGASMLEKAFENNKDIYSEDFKDRIRACIVQHHGKPQYGSPVSLKTQEAFVVHYADYIDATFNAVGDIVKNTNLRSWSQYDQRIDGKLYV